MQVNIGAKKLRLKIAMCNCVQPQSELHYIGGSKKNQRKKTKFGGSHMLGTKIAALENVQIQISFGANKL